MLDEKTLQSIHAEELNILLKIVEICDRHELTYFLDGGTLLGAVRHEGYIPWDDDTDVAMPISDVNAFVSYASEELGDEYVVKSFINDPCFYRNYIKVIRKNTTVVADEWLNVGTYHGAWVDIFPMVYVDEKKVPRYQSLYRWASYIQKYDYYVHNNPKPQSMKGVVALYGMKLFRILGTKGQIRLHTWLLKKLCSGRPGTVICIWDLELYPHKACDIFGNIQHLNFEGHALRVPSNYKGILEELYGNYMELPPLDQRGNHGKLYVDMTKNYEEFIQSM